MSESFAVPSDAGAEAAGAAPEPAQLAAPAVAAGGRHHLSARRTGVAAGRRPRSLRAHRRLDAPHLARRACASGRDRTLDAAGRRDRPRAVARPSGAAARERSSVAPRDLGLFDAEGDPAARRAIVDRRALRIVLRHELAHIRRGDWVVQIAGEILRTAYWFNPLVWIACARLRQESEQACDDEVLTSDVDGPDYATHLAGAGARCSRPRPRRVCPRPPLPVRRVSKGESAPCWTLNLTRTPATRSVRFMTAAALLDLTVALAAAQTGPVTFSGSVVRFDRRTRAWRGGRADQHPEQGEVRSRRATTPATSSSCRCRPTPTRSRPRFRVSRSAEDSVSLTGKSRAARCDAAARGADRRRFQCRIESGLPRSRS